MGYAARKGIASQQTSEPARLGAPDNLMAPVPGDFGAHGRFDDRSRLFSPQLWATKHRGLLSVLGGAVAIAAGLVCISKSSKA